MVDSFNRKKVLLSCLFFYFILFGGYLAATSLAVFAVIRTIHGGPFGAATVANSTVAIDVLPSSRRNEGIGFYGLSNNVATAIAPTVGIMIYEGTHNFNILFLLALAIAAVGLVIDSRVKIGFCYGVLSNYLAIYGKETLGITGGTGVYFMLLSIGLILSRMQGAKALREGKLTRNAAEGIILSTIGYTIFVAGGSMWTYYGSAILIGLGNGHMWPAFQNMMVNLAHNNQRGTANSTLMTSWDLGVGLGILAGGFVAEHFGYASAFWTVSAIHVASAVMYFVLTRGNFERNKLR